MKIVVLDGHVLNPGDVSWAPLQAFGEVQVHDRTPVEQIESRAKLAEAVFTVRTPLNRETIRHLTNLRYIGVLGSDPSHVNIEAAKKRGIEVADTAGIDTESTAQLTIALLLELTHGAGHHAHAARNGRWSRGPDISFRLQPLMELNQRTIGIVGMGRIGSAVARIAAAFGMRVLACDPALPPNASAHATAVGWETLLAEADVVSLHCPHTPVTERMINTAALERMKPTAYLINTAHGALVDEEALADALHARRLGGAALDVLSSEPPSPKNPLLRAPRCLITPHVGWGTRAVRERIIVRAAEQLGDFIRRRASS